MPTGEVNYVTRAVTLSAEGIVRTITNLSGLTCGINSVAVEVHQESLTTSDNLFGAELIARVPFFAVPSCGGNIRVMLNLDGTVTLDWFPPTAMLQETDGLGNEWRDLPEATRRGG